MESKQEVRVGIIGAAGFIGRGHLHRIATAVEHARPTMIHDVNEEKVRVLAEQYQVQVADSVDALIQSDEVDAVMITSWDPTHADFTIRAIQAGKPVFCEKPLANTLEECTQIIEAERKSGKKLVQVGFMRRYDPDFVKMKEILQSGELGAPLMAHCISRTPNVAPGFTDSMHVTANVIHEIDQFRWLLGENIVKGQMLYARPSCFAEEGLHDPQLALMWTDSGVLIDIESACHSHYGYEIMCEVVCEKGTVRLPLPAAPEVRTRLTCSSEIMDDWSERFPVAYQIELQNWVDYILGLTEVSGPGAEDGYEACAVSDALVASQTSGQIEAVTIQQTAQAQAG